MGTAKRSAAVLALCLLAATGASGQEAKAASGAHAGHAAMAASAGAPATLPMLHPWQVPPPGLTAEAYFTNLQPGAKIETPFLATFGLSGGWGLAPITKPVAGKTGHHHLLINRDLPLDFKQPLPFNEQYIHFGKGQMESVLNLSPGSYTLRLVLADEKHIPRFVYSKPMPIVVTAKKAGVDPKSLIVPHISILAPGDKAAIKPPFRVQFHATGLNVAVAEQQEKDTGHFRLTVMGKSGKTAEMDFVGGQTEAWLAPPAGSYTLKLELLDNLTKGKPMAEPVMAAITVQ